MWKKNVSALLGKRRDRERTESLPVRVAQARVTCVMFLFLLGGKKEMCFQGEEWYCLIVCVCVLMCVWCVGCVWCCKCCGRVSQRHWQVCVMRSLRVQCFVMWAVKDRQDREGRCVWLSRAPLSLCLCLSACLCLSLLSTQLHQAMQPLGSKQRTALLYHWISMDWFANFRPFCSFQSV